MSSLSPTPYKHQKWRVWSVPLCLLDGFGPTTWTPFAFAVAGLEVNPTSPGSSQTFSCLCPLGKTAAPASSAFSSHPGPTLFLGDFKIHQPGLSAPSPLRGLHPVPLQLPSPWPPPGPHRPRELASASCPLGAQSVGHFQDHCPPALPKALAAPPSPLGPPVLSRAVPLALILGPLLSVCTILRPQRHP